MAAWSSELQVHRIAFPLWVFAFTLGFPTIFPTNAPNLRKTSRYILKRINTRRSPNPLQHRGLGDLTWHEWVRRKSSHGFLVRMRSAVRIRPAAPKVLFSIENRTFSLLFANLICGSRCGTVLTHTVTHTRKCAERAKKERKGSSAIYQMAFATFNAQYAYSFIF